jgi:hypothetical protein
MYVDFKRFDQAVNRFAELVREGSATVVLAGQRGAVGLNIEPGTSDVPVPGDGLYNDVDDALGAVISNVPIETFVAARRTSRPPMFAGTEEEDVARKKYQAIVDAFPIGDLRLKAHLRWTSSVPAFAELSWEVITRHAGSSDTDGGVASTAPYAVMKLTSQRATENPFAPDQDVATFAIDPKTVDEVIEILERLRTALSTEASQ